MLLQFAGSVAAIVVLAGMAWALGLGGGGIADEAEAMRIAEDALTGFDAVSARVAADGRAALVTGADGSFAVVKLHGAQPAVRRVTAAQVREESAAVVVDTGERLFGRVTIAQSSSRT